MKYVVLDKAKFPTCQHPSQGSTDNF